MSNTKQTSTESDKERDPTDLLPCFFCGSQPVTDVFKDEEDHFHFVSCENEVCPASVCATGHTPEAAAARWNTRLTAPVATPTEGQPS